MQSTDEAIVPHQVGRGVVKGAPMTADAALHLARSGHPAERPRPYGWTSLAFKLLLLSLAFVLLAEVLIFLPSIGRAQRDYLEQRLAFGHLALLALDAAPDGMVDPKMQMTLLDHADANLVALRGSDGANSLLSNGAIRSVDRQLILNQLSAASAILAALNTLMLPPAGQLRVVGDSPKNAAVEVEVVMEAAPLRRFLVQYAGRIALLSLFISVVTASLIYGVLIFLIVRPVERMTQAMRLFAQDPEDQRFDLSPTQRRDELGEAESQFAQMRQTVRQAFHQKSRLAALGTGLTRITHDLRNIMSTTVLLSDGLETSRDPMVQRVAPRLSREISRAEALCLATVTYATDGPLALQPTEVDLDDLLAAVQDRFRPRFAQLTCTVKAKGARRLRGDRSQLERVLDNLLQNAEQMGATRATLAVERQADAIWLIAVSDNGPGLPPRARDHLFTPFAGSARKGGTGLGLPLSRDILRAHGGELRLAYSDATRGTRFELILPGG